MTSLLIPSLATSRVGRFREGFLIAATHRATLACPPTGGNATSRCTEIALQLDYFTPCIIRFNSGDNTNRITPATMLAMPIELNTDT